MSLSEPGPDLAELRGVAARMRGIAGRIQSGTADPEEMGELARCCEESLPVIQAATRRTEGLSGEERAAVLRELEGLMRLNAILQSGARQHRDELALRLSELRRNARNLKRYSGGSSGDSCDVRA